jgi:hypothetical protein
LLTLASSAVFPSSLSEFTHLNRLSFEIQPFHYLLL